MTHYDKLIDCINDYLHIWYKTGQMDGIFNEGLARHDAHKILKVVEEYQQKLTLADSPKTWRASD